MYRGRLWFWLCCSCRWCCRPGSLCRGRRDWLPTLLVRLLLARCSGFFFPGLLRNSAAKRRCFQVAIKTNEAPKQRLADFRHGKLRDEPGHGRRGIGLTAKRDLSKFVHELNLLLMGIVKIMAAG